ncbi:sigma-70 family RNA polymerase sigma factor [Solwaraspora sp. WMMA2080]|nr:MULTISPECIES: sigma-70 family RNA polymerase sigma factor [unclassified Solwaraspora]WBB98739.1 sigma-70 family RNA polymerase sigma factor [Solwaraspora sp. WMMA2059]WBC22708.1 sigma-70 family RNA polymerase sigma factor [Solwaraspora sp. WMMA2080]
MYAVASGWQAERTRPGLTGNGSAMARSTQRWQSIDGRAAERDDEPVTPRTAGSRQQAGTAESSHGDDLVRTLYAEHARPLLGFVLRLTGGDRQRAEDIVQETLLRAWRNAHRLGAQGQASLRPWLVTVARRIAIDDHRSEKARPTEEYDRDLESFAESDGTDQVLRQMTVADALRTLSQPHREILVETYFRGRTVPEAAAELGLPLGTAKSRVYYALRALRTALQQRGVTE